MRGGPCGTPTPRLVKRCPAFSRQRRFPLASPSGANYVPDATSEVNDGRRAYNARDPSRLDAEYWTTSTGADSA